LIPPQRKRRGSGLALGMGSPGGGGGGMKTRDASGMEQVEQMVRAGTGLGVTKDARQAMGRMEISRRAKSDATNRLLDCLCTLYLTENTACVR
jgi:hypothetical protein